LNKRGEGMYDHMRGVGAHEVIIDAPQTVRSISELEEAQVRDMLFMYRDRLFDLRKDPRLKYGLIFKNVGSAAGATMFHSHSQLVVTPTVPQAVMQKIQSCQEYSDFRGRCLLCDMIVQELEQTVRIVIDSDRFLAFEPYAPRTPFETWILPKTHASHFEEITPADAEDLAVVLRRVIKKLEQGLGAIAYNYMLCTAPFDAGALPHFHWHLEIVPRLTKQAGFEWGSGMYINPVPPENAAEFLRDVKA
jgi:UDPglucose--hexose-1-phosphate uridylyltransferase